jgi:hypothetical protein
MVFLRAGLGRGCTEGVEIAKISKRDQRRCQLAHADSHMARDRCSTRQRSRISSRHQEVIMRRIVASLSAVLMLTAGTAVAQDKMKDAPKSGHEGMAKAEPNPTLPSSRRRRVPRRRTSAATPRSWASSARTRRTPGRMFTCASRRSANLTSLGHEPGARTSASACAEHDRFNRPATTTGRPAGDRGARATATHPLTCCTT